MSQSLQMAEPGGREIAIRDDAQMPWDMASEDAAEEKLSKVTRYGLISIAVLVFGVGGLLALLPMASAVIASGEVTVETHVREIAHPFGGVAADILVSDGDRVNAGDVLIRLDDTVAGAQADLTGLSLDQLLAREARLRAVRDGSGSIAFPAELTERADDPEVAAIMADERRELALARQALGDQRNQLQARIAQTQASITARQRQIEGFARQDELLTEELTQTRELYENSLSTLDRLNALERAAVGVQSERDTAQAQIFELQARITEFRTQMASLGSQNRSTAAADLAQVQAQIADSRQREVTASDTSDRTAIRATQDGIVNKLAVNTIGGVVPAGETLLEIVPADDRLVVRASVAVTDIDQVQIDQPATMRFTALSMRTTPELRGVVTQVDADRTTDQATGATYYKARIEISEEEFARLGDVQLTVGMPVEVFIQTGERTILSYILRPLSDQLKRALRE